MTERARDRRCTCVPPEHELRRVPGAVWPGCYYEMGLAIRAVADQLLQNEWRPRSEIEARQLEQLCVLLRFAGKQSPFYADRFRSIGFSPDDVTSVADFRALPLLTRHDLQDRFEEIKAGELPAGTMAQGELRTSGSTAAPVKVVVSNVSHLMWNACTVRNEVWAGIDPRGTLVAIRRYPEGSPRLYTEQGMGVDDWGGLVSRVFVTGPARFMDIGQELPAQLAMLLRVNPDYFLSYPTNLELLGRMLGDRREGLTRLKLVQTIGELLPLDTRDTIEEAFGAPVHDLYSCVEVGCIASQCPSGSGYHVHEENVLLEVIDEAGRPCPPGGMGRIVVTSLVNFAFPVIRYDVGDYATLADGPCPCGRNLLGLREIIGRKRGRILMPDGRTKYPVGVTRVMRLTEAVRQYMVIQHERTRFEVIIVPRQSFRAEHEEQVRERFRLLVGVPVEVSFTFVDHIERTPGGKYLDFVCKAQ